jgi:hypothetical protein
MSDPRRLLEDAGLDSDMKALLRSVEVPVAPDDAKLRALGELLVLKGSATASTLGALAWLKLGLGAAAVGLATFGYLMLRPSAPPPTARIVSTVTRVPGQVPSTAPDPGVMPEPLAAASAPRASGPRAQPNADSLAEEAQLLEQARRLKVSSPHAALALLDQHRQKYPRGELAAERLFLGVDVWKRLGNQAMSDKQAAALIQHFPSSVYAAQLKARRARD